MTDTMETRSPRLSAVAAVSAIIGLALLAVVVLASAIAVIPFAQLMADENPEFAHLHDRLLVAALAFALCVEVILVVAAILVKYIRSGRIYSQQALVLVTVIIGAFIVATVLIAVVLPSIPGPPVLALLLIVGMLAGLTSTLVLVVLRNLLRNASTIRGELDEVV
jgi:hypothetical protein